MTNLIDVSSSVSWQCLHFSRLTTNQVYEILRARNEVFVVEQNCPYQDCDNKDLDAMHITGHLKNDLVAYSRLISPGIAFTGAASIGRILTVPNARKKEIGKALMKYSIQRCESLYQNFPIIIAAQLYLEKFYMEFKFRRSGENFLEDNIPHLPMYRAYGM
ncbi:MAG: GNAT family N-acetyltransferase [Ginsengibacter sp.]